MVSSVVLGCLLLGLAALPGGLTSEHELDKVAIDVIKETVSHVSPLNRGRRDLQKEIDWFIQPNKPWCFCGNESWLTSLMKVNLEESEKCVRDSELNLAAVRGKPVSRTLVATIGRATRCAYDCIFQKLNLIDSEGNLKKTKVKEIFRDKVFLFDNLKEIGFTVVDRCLNNETANTLTSKALLSYGEGATCGEKAKIFIICMLLEMVQDCPENLKRNDVDHCVLTYKSFAVTRNASQSSCF